MGKDNSTSRYYLILNIRSYLYGLLDPSYKGQDVYGIPHPALYVIDKSGRVSWVKIESNYRERPANGEIRAALDALR